MIPHRSLILPLLLFALYILIFSAKIAAESLQLLNHKRPTAEFCQSQPNNARPKRRPAGVKKTLNEKIYPTITV